MRRLAAGVLLAGILLVGCSPAPAAENSTPVTGSSTPPVTPEPSGRAPGQAPAPDETAPEEPAPDETAPNAAARLAALIGDPGVSGEPGKPAHVVLLGDSFASGEGAGSYEPVNGVAESLCHRSSEALVLAGEPDPGNRLVVHNFACSHARISALETAQQMGGHRPGGIPAQLEQMAGVRPDLVLLYIGGNDLGFADLLQACVAAADPCGEDSGLAKSTEEKLLHLGPALAETYRTVGTAARSPVLVLPYPRMFEARAADCGRLTAAEQAFGLKVTDNLNAVLEQSVQAAGLPGVRYVDALEDSFAGRGACSSDPLVKTARIGPLLGAVTSVSASQEILHPTSDGYRVLTEDLIQWLEEHPA